ncbi:CBS domain-containing protein [Nakamurella panacisegetis]|uniref:CBS domain-containing protein n=1 Tax=Nakamurella panacisegetis TaxID=1090615 RepID=A0A1H0SBX2_9ACTN|nr:CBS domain-containing protein [Nakamurella panacisegetis]SDP39009.1 CBS domain-containing protein [Nakamurella panacisegetis]
MRAREIMSSPVVSVPPDMPVTQASDLLAQRGFTALPVVDEDGRLIGLVTEADLIRDRVAPDPRIHGFASPATGGGRASTVADVMTTSVESFTPGADVADIARTMLDERVRCFPIVDGNAVVGVITRRDLLRSAVSHSDLELERDVTKALAALDDSDRWQVTVQGGVAQVDDVEDGPDSARDDDRARSTAAGVPGIVAATMRHRPPDRT